MKNIFIVSILLIFQISIAQEGEIEYKIAYEKKLDDNSEFGKKLAKELKLMSFSLRYNNKESFFEKLPNIPVDELSAKLAIVKANVTGNWYQKPISKKAFYNRDIGGTEYLIMHDYRMQDWKLTNETKKIEEFTCYKATLKVFNKRSSSYSIVEAWYTPKVSLPYGPIGFGGLPGLILQLKYKQVTYITSNILLNPKKGVKSYSKPNMKNPINTDEMVQLMRKNRKVTVD